MDTSVALKYCNETADRVRACHGSCHDEDEEPDADEELDSDCGPDFDFSDVELLPLEWL